MRGWRLRWGSSSEQQVFHGQVWVLCNGHEVVKGEKQLAAGSRFISSGCGLVLHGVVKGSASRS